GSYMSARRRAWRGTPPPPSSSIRSKPAWPKVRTRGGRTSPCAPAGRSPRWAPGSRRPARAAPGAPRTSGTAPHAPAPPRPGLPHPMRPRLFAFAGPRPLAPGGSPDEGRLPPPEAAADRAPAAPRGEIEEKLAALWREVLSLASVGVDQNFFELGGDSILA